MSNNEPQIPSLLLTLRLQRQAKLALPITTTALARPHVPGGDRDGEEGLGLADGAALLELDEVADLEPVLGVVGLELLLLPHTTLVLGMGGEARDLDGDGLVAGGADDATLQGAHGPDGGEGSDGRAGGGEREGGGLREERERGGPMEEGGGGGGGGGGEFEGVERMEERGGERHGCWSLQD